MFMYRKRQRFFTIVECQQGSTVTITLESAVLWISFQAFQYFLIQIESNTGYSVILPVSSR